LLRLARGRADWILVLDADMELDAGAGIWPAVAAASDVDALMIPVVEDELYYLHPLLVRSEVNWEYRGVTHEYLAADRAYHRVPLGAARVVHHADGGSRGGKIERDRLLLERALQEDPDDERTVFYLAQTYRDLGRQADAIALYRRRIAMGGWDEEVFYSRYQLGRLLVESDWPTGRAALTEAWASRPERFEPLYRLVVGCREHGEWGTAYRFVRDAVDVAAPSDVLFLEGWVYRFGLLFERSVSAWHVGEHQQALEDTQRLAAFGDLPEPWRSQVSANLSRMEGPPVD
jgi:tetratricopeptide (TPR) repeat protein